MKVEALFYKNFAKHLLENGQGEKGLKALEKSIDQHKNLVIDEYQKFKEFNKKREVEETKVKKDKATKEREELQANAMK